MNYRIARKTLTLVLASTLLLSFTCGDVLAKKKKLFKKVKIESYDHFMLNGEVRLPKCASIKDKVPVVILLHQLGKDYREWEKLSKDFNDKNLAVLMYDLRGHGKSTSIFVTEESIKEEQKPKYWNLFKNKDFADYPEDIISSVKFLKENYPEIDTNKVAIVGSDLSANAAVIAANKMNDKVKTLVLLSPTMSFKGLATPIQLVAYGEHPVLIMNSKLDIYSYKEGQELVKYAQGEVKNIAFPAGGTGLNLLKHNPIAQKIMYNWFDKYFKHVPKPPEPQLTKEEKKVYEKIPPEIPYKPEEYQIKQNNVNYDSKEAT